MTREQIAGFMLGISVGTAIGFFLRPPNPTDEDNGRQFRFAGTRNLTDHVRKTGDPKDRRWPISGSSAG